MTTGEKLAALRKKKGLTQDQLAEILKVSRQSVSRWEQDLAFPETEKLIKLSRLLECSIDYLLNDDIQSREETKPGISVDDCCRFIRECGYFFLATSSGDRPKLRPMGMICSNGKNLFLVTDKRKNVYADLMINPQVELASYNLNSRRWIRISGTVEVESSGTVRDEVVSAYPMIRQEYSEQDEMNRVILRLLIEHIDMY